MSTPYVIDVKDEPGRTAVVAVEVLSPRENPYALSTLGSHREITLKEYGDFLVLPARPLLPSPSMKDVAMLSDFESAVVKLLNLYFGHQRTQAAAAGGIKGKAHGLKSLVVGGSRTLQNCIFSGKVKEHLDPISLGLEEKQSFMGDLLPLTVCGLLERLNENKPEVARGIIARAREIVTTNVKNC